MKTDEAIEILKEFYEHRLTLPVYEDGKLVKALSCAIEHMKRFRWRPIEQKLESENPNDHQFIVAGKAVKPFTGYYVSQAFVGGDGLFRTDQGRLKNQPTYFMPLPEFDGEKNEQI